jgi:putative flippase GtrA
MTRAEPRYLAVAASCALVHNAVMIAGDLAGLHYVHSSAISFILVVAWGYAWHARFTFRAPASAASLMRYALAMAGNYPLSIALMFVLCDLMGVAVVVAAPLATVILVLWNFAVSRWAITSRLVPEEPTR